jgi:hypothetical protein
MYLSDPNNVEHILDSTGLTLNELEEIVGRFKADHHAWPNELKGEFKEDWDGVVKIVHHFTGKTLWESK